MIENLSDLSGKSCSQIRVQGQPGHPSMWPERAAAKGMPGQPDPRDPMLTTVFLQAPHFHPGFSRFQEILQVVLFNILC